MPFTSSEAFSFTYREKQRWKHKTHFYDSMKPILVASRIFGLLPFTAHTDSKGRIERTSVDTFNAIFFIGVVTLNLLFAYFSQFVVLKQKSATSVVFYFSDRLLWATQLLICLSSIILGMLNRNRFAKLVRDVTEFDKYVKSNIFETILSNK